MKTISQLDAQAFFEFNDLASLVLTELQNNRISTKKAIGTLLEAGQTSWAAAVRVATGERDAVLQEADIAIEKGELEEAACLYDLADASVEQFEALGDMCVQGMKIPGCDATNMNSKLAVFCFDKSGAEEKLIRVITDLCTDDLVFQAVKLCKAYVCPNEMVNGRETIMLCAQKSADKGYARFVQDLYNRYMRGDEEFETRFGNWLPAKRG